MIIDSLIKDFKHSGFVVNVKRDDIFKQDNFKQYVSKGVKRQIA